MCLYNQQLFSTVINAPKAAANLRGKDSLWLTVWGNSVHCGRGSCGSWRDLQLRQGFVHIQLDQEAKWGAGSQRAINLKTPPPVSDSLQLVPNS